MSAMSGRGGIICFGMSISISRASRIRGHALNKVRPFAGLDFIFMRETTAFSRYHGLLSSFRHEAGRAGFLTLNYTFSRNNADASYDNSERDLPQNVLDKTAEYGSAQTDRSHIFNMSYVYELPFGRGSTGWRKGLMQGWQVAGITRVESGPAARLQRRQLQLSWRMVRDLVAAEPGGRPRRGGTRGALLVRFVRVRKSACRRVWHGPCQSVPAAWPPPMGHHPCQELSPYRYGSPPVQGGDD